MHAYIHVPFCARRCSYCDFSIAVRHITPSAEFAASILAEWKVRQHLVSPSAVMQTIYFGGGTPSRLAPEYLAELIAHFRSARDFAPDIEITIEANPDDVTAEAARAWVAAGVNRISLGVQSHDPAVLAWMHRTHSAEQVPPAVQTLRDAGIQNISVDLIFGLPVAQQRDWARDLDLTFALNPEHISLYGLTIESHTPLGHWTARGESSPVPDERYAEEYIAAHKALLASGFDHYEVSNAGRPGRWSKHNNACWREADYIGLGPSAHSFLGGIRSWNISAWAEFARLIGRGESTEAGSELLDATARSLERHYLGLRTSAGLPMGEIPERTRSQWLSAGWGNIENGRFTLSIDGWLRLDALVASLQDS